MATHNDNPMSTATWEDALIICMYSSINQLQPGVPNLWAIEQLEISDVKLNGISSYLQYLHKIISHISMN